MKEIWKDIPEYEGIYRISNFGNIRTLDRYVTDINKTQFIRGKTLKPFDNGKGYMVVSLHKNGKRKNKYIHRLVAELFLNNYNENLTINHKDFNTKNNKYNNLEVVTQKENIGYSVKNGRYIESNKRKVNKQIEKAIKKVRDKETVILNFYRNGIGINEISKKFHLKYDNVAKIIKEKMKWIIVCVETNEKFDTIKDANKKYNVTTIGDSINGRQKTSAGYHWIKILEEYEG